MNSSPRLVESDCGALLLALIFEKYVICCQWSFDLHTIFYEQLNTISDINCLIFDCPNAQISIISFLSSLNLLLSHHLCSVSDLKLNKQYQTSQNRVHGILTFLREIFPKLPFVKNGKNDTNKKQWIQMISAFLKNIFAIGEKSLVLHVRDPKQKSVEDVSKIVPKKIRKDSFSDEIELDFNEVNFLNNNINNCDSSNTSIISFAKLENDFCDQQTEQLIVVSSWLSMKEVCLTLAILVKYCIPTLINIEDVEKIGDFLLRTLKNTQHCGVIEKAQNAFTSICISLLDQQQMSSSLIVSGFLDELLLMIKNESEQHWIRRSAGFPSTFISILQAECKVYKHSNEDRVLFSRTMNSLLNICSDGSWQSKVVALNILTFIFRDSLFGTIILSFVTCAFEIVLHGFNHSEWAVRNSCMLCLSAILFRAIRRRRAKKSLKVMEDNLIEQYIHENNEENEYFMKPFFGNDGTTGEAFFNEHTRLHSYLLQHLKEGIADTEHIHPSLFPVLLLLSVMYYTLCMIIVCTVSLFSLSFV